ncbi:MAG TPA: biotin/lipoyl-binding protein, partial [Xanthobacteraceae bacterium]|nr:biotin/lipoyl-binding protein [Xanthobacteraceae bacterium]
MKAAGNRHHAIWATFVSLAIIAGAIAFGFYELHRTSNLPSTNDGTIDADVVHVAAAVGGRIVDLPVEENARVVKGDLLFQIDPEPFRLAVEQTRADLELAEAALETQRRAVSTQRSAATVAADQVRRATTNLDLAARTVERLRPLASKGYVPAQQLDQAVTAQRDADTSLSQTREQQTAAVRATDTDAGAEATVRARQAALAIAQRALEDATVRAPHAGRVVGLTVLTGEMV